jgi:hypothetical protein
MMETAFISGIPASLTGRGLDAEAPSQQDPPEESTSTDEPAEDEAALAGVFGGIARSSQVVQAEQGPALSDGELSSSELPAGTANATDSIPAGGGKKSKPPLPSLPSDGTALVVAISDLAGNQSGNLREHGVGRRTPGGTGSRTNTPANSGGTSGLPDGDIPEQGDGQDFGLVSELEDTGGFAEDDGFLEDERSAAASTPDTSQAPLIQLWGDVNGDGLLDVLIQAGDENLSLQLNVGHGSFQDITVWSGLGEHAPGVERAVAWIDVEADGNLDLLAVSDDKRLRLFRGRGAGRFDEVGEVAGLAVIEDVEDVTTFDIDGNGALDLRVSTAGNGLMLLLNDGLGRFRSVVLRAADSPDVPEVSAGSDADPAGTPGR